MLKAQALNHDKSPSIKLVATWHWCKRTRTKESSNCQHSRSTQSSATVEATCMRRTPRIMPFQGYSQKKNQTEGPRKFWPGATEPQPPPWTVFPTVSRGKEHTRMHRHHPPPHTKGTPTPREAPTPRGPLYQGDTYTRKGQKPTIHPETKLGIKCHSKTRKSP